MFDLKQLSKIAAILLAATLIGCTGQNRPSHQQIASINIIDRNGLSETISSKDRLDLYQNVDFLTCQPYQKVLRVFGRTPDGSICSCITSYHPNGQLRQYLEAVNGRACGMYREWHSNGKLKLEAKVIGGAADINTGSENSWVFDRVTKAWNEEGNLVVEIPYCKGELEGVATYYFPTGAIKRSESYAQNQLHGPLRVFLPNGMLLQMTEYCKGEKHGISKQVWTDQQVACDEIFQNGLLIEGTYFDRDGVLLAEVHEGNGWRAVFHEEGGYQLQEYRKGKQEGCVKTYDKNEKLIRVYALKEGRKDGEELIYIDGDRCVKVPAGTPPRPILMVSWVDGAVQGIVKSWYENGNMESQREMSFNKKNGMFTAWYRQGGLMLLEEYHHDSLVSGEYFRRDDRFPVSKVVNGKGTATIFDADGRFLRKVTYRDGRIVE